MGTSDVSEGFSDWEEIPDGYQPLLALAGTQEFELIIRDDYYSDGTSVFPPSEHEDLPILHQDVNSREEDTPSVSLLPVTLSDVERTQQQPVRSASKFSAAMCDVRIGISSVRNRLLKVFASSFRCQTIKRRRCWAVVPPAALAVALLACLKILRWRNRILFLLKEKDQRIGQLLSQITHMNEILSARRKVPILKINERHNT